MSIFPSWYRKWYQIYFSGFQVRNSSVVTTLLVIPISKQNHIKGLILFNTNYLCSLSLYTTVSEYIEFYPVASKPLEYSRLPQFILKSSLYLDGDDKMSSILQEVVSVQSNNPSLVRLGNISKNYIHHS